MNGVSDANLAIAVSKAGAVPSLSLPNYMRGLGTIFYKEDLVKDIDRFCKATNSSNIIISMTDFHLFQQYNFLYSLYKEYKIKHLEIIIMSRGDSHYKENEDIDYIKRLISFQQLGAKVLVKSVSYPNDIIGRFKTTTPIMDGIIIKGTDGAGKINYAAYKHKPISIKTLSSIAVEMYPNKAVVPSGGICTAEEIQSYLDLGCAAVGIGTLFALSAESKVAENSKLEIIANNKRKLDTLVCEGLNQNAFIFKEYTGRDNSNHSSSLKLGVLGKGGHLFMGKGMSVVDEILPVAEIIDRLTNINVPTPSGVNTIM